MSDHHDHDDLIREALRAEATGVAADQSLLERIRDGAPAARPTGMRRGAPWLVAAAAAVVAGVAAVIAQDDAHQTVVVVDDPDITSPVEVEGLLPSPREACAASDGQILVVVMSAAATHDDIGRISDHLAMAADSGPTPLDEFVYVDEAEVYERAQQRLAGDSPELDSLMPDQMPTYFVVTMPAGTDDVGVRGELADLPGVLSLSSTDCSGASPPTALPSVEPPSQAVAVTERGRIEVLDTATGGVVRDLGGFEDPTDPEIAQREGGPYSIVGVALHPNGRDVYFETCCEPAAGAIFRVPVDGSVSIDSSRLAPVAYGYGMDISADGRWLAYVSGPVVSVMDLETGEVHYTAESGDGTHGWVQVAINADGSVLAIERVLERSADGSAILRSDARTVDVTRADGEYEEHDVPSGRFIPIWIEGGRMLASAPAPGTSPRDVNLDAAGDWILEVTEDGRLEGRSEEMVAIPGGPYLAADW
jgi:hypothetical protein